MAKIGTRRSIPIPPSPTIKRSRLLNDLDTVLQHKLTMIAAPPGFGKTTLVAQFAQHVKAPVIWQTIEESDHDTPNLYEHSLIALSEIAPGISDIQANPRSNIVELVTSITNYLREHLAEDLIYILDDAHYIIGTGIGDTWLQTLVSTLPSHCHLMVISRVLPVLPVIEMIARREILAIGQAQLRFTPEEILELAHQVDSEVSVIDAHRLMERLDGWPAGIVLALQPLPVEFESTYFNDETAPEALFNDLARQMLDHQSAALKRFLLISSTLTRITPDLCEHVLHLSNSALHLSEALRRSLFLYQVPGGVIHHSLFRDFLQHQLQMQSPDEFVELHRKAGEWFENAGRPDDAFTHYVTGQLWYRAAQIAQRVAQAFFAQGKVATLLKWNSQLVEINISAPQLHYACAMIHVDRYQYDQALAELAKADEGFESLADSTGLFQVQLLLGTIDNQRGQFQGAAHRSSKLLQNPHLPNHLRGHILVTLGHATLQLGDAEAALKHFETALPLHREVGDLFAISQVLQFLALAYVRLGRFDEAGQCLQEIVTTRRAFGGATGLSVALNDLGYYYHQSGDYERAFQTFQEGLTLVSQFPQRRTQGYLLWSIGDLQRDRGAFHEASHYYARSLESVTDSEPALKCGVLNSLAILRKWQGRATDAENAAQEAFELASHYHLALEQTKAEVNLRILQAQQDLKVAEEKLDHLAKIFRQQQSDSRLAQVWGLCAYLALLQQDEAKAMRYFKSIDTKISHQANLQSLVAEVLHTPMLHEFVRKRGLRYPRIMGVLQRLEQAEVQSVQDDIVDSETTIPTLSLHIATFGQEKVDRNGTPIPTSSWRMMGRSLFFYLLFEGPASREQICLTFWPESTAEQVRHNFHSTLHRVRKILGENAVIFQDERYFISPDLDLWCDAFEFEALVQEARLLAPRTAHAESLWQRAVHLYKGDFLPKNDQEWAAVRREKLHEIYLETLVGWGNCLRARGDLPKAVDLYKRAVAVDPFREDIHRMILVAYNEQGKRRQAQKHYTALIQLLQDELAVDPSDETRRLADALLA